MDNFTKSDFTFNGVTYKRYTGDRKRGGESWVFYGEAPYDTTYSPTWPKAVEGDATFDGVFFISNICGDDLCVDFLQDLSVAEENALDTLYDNHVAPVPV